MIRVGATLTVEIENLRDTEIPAGQPGHLIDDATVELVSITPPVTGIALPLPVPKVDGIAATYRARIPASVTWQAGRTYTLRARAVLPGGEQLPITIREQAVG